MAIKKKGWSLAARLASIKARQLKAMMNRKYEIHKPRHKAAPEVPAVKRPKLIDEYKTDRQKSLELRAKRDKAQADVAVIPGSKTQWALPKPGVKTVVKYKSPDGQYTAKRKVLHQGIMATILDSVKRSADPRYLFMGGGTASGKSTFMGAADKGHYTGNINIPSKDKHEAVFVDSDAIKKHLPEFEGLKSHPSYTLQAAGLVHDESSDIASAISRLAVDAERDVVLDGTGNNSVKSMQRKITDARKKGHKVSAIYLTCSVEEAIRRSSQRSSKGGSDPGRHVDEGVIREKHQQVTDVFLGVHKEFDDVELWDTGVEGKPVLVARGTRGQELNVLNQELFGQFRSKGSAAKPKKPVSLSKGPATKG